METTCSFKVRGPDNRNWIPGEVLSIEYASPTKLGLVNKSGNHVGWLPYFLNDLLITAIAGTPNGKFECEVEKVFPYESFNGIYKENKLSIMCKLHENPALPEMLSGIVKIVVFGSHVKGVERTEVRSNTAQALWSLDRIPEITLQRERTNPVDLNAILIFCLIDGIRLELGYVDANDASEICKLTAIGYKYFARLTDCAPAFDKSKEETKIKYEIIMSETDSAGFKSLT